MSRRNRNRIPPEPRECTIESLSHDGRGIARIDGKTQFVDGALPGEQVIAKVMQTHRRFDELRAELVSQPNPDRVQPPCAHADLCGGCSLQHMDPAAQIRFKEGVLREQFAHFGGISPERWEAPMLSPQLGYRRKARLGVRYVVKRESVLVGFREKRNRFLTDIERCEVLDPRVGGRITEMRELLGTLEAYSTIAQIEVACGDDAAALVVRHLEPLSESDSQKLIDFGKAHQLHIYYQPKGPDTVHRVWPEVAENESPRLHYQLPDFDLSMAFHPMDFTQVNSHINQRMIALALKWLEPGENDRILDLFCGLGNFTLPLARKAGQVVGVEGDEAMVVRGRENASANGLENVAFHGADLQGDFAKEPWAKEGFNKILIDPPRTGALDICQYIPAFGAERIVYVSCNPATLARDAGALAERGYRLVRAGVMDMFPHTTHVESIALFERA